MHPHDIDSGLLLKLDALLRERHVSNAARRVGLTQSAMSHALGRLRAHFGDPLLVRTGSGMALTPKAEAMAPRVARLVRELAALWSSAGEHEPEPLPGLFAISASEVLQMVLVPGIVAILHAEAPHADLVAMPAGSEAIELLRRGASDLALGAFGALLPDIHQQTLITDDLVCLVRQGHPVVTSGMTLAAYTALSHVQVGAEEPLADVVERRLAKQGLTRRMGCTVTSYGAALAIVGQSDAVLTLPGLLAERVAPSHGLERLPLPLRLAPNVLSMAWHARTGEPDVCAWLRQVVLRAAKHLGDPMAPQATDMPTAHHDTNEDNESASSNRRRRDDDCIE